MLSSSKLLVPKLLCLYSSAECAWKVNLVWWSFWQTHIWPDRFSLTGPFDGSARTTILVVQLVRSKAQPTHCPRTQRVTFVYSAWLTLERFPNSNNTIRPDLLLWLLRSPRLRLSVWGDTLSRNGVLSNSMNSMCKRSHGTVCDVLCTQTVNKLSPEWIEFILTRSICLHASSRLRQAWSKHRDLRLSEPFVRPTNAVYLHPWAAWLAKSPITLGSFDERPGKGFCVA